MNNNVVTPQPTTIETATSEFHAGVTAVLRSYSALKTAVEKEWGGVASKEKAEFLRTHILNCFDYTKKNPSVDVYDLEDNIAIYMEEEFSVVVEDDSEKLIAQAIFSLYENCGNGNFTLSRQFVDNVTKAAQEKGKVFVQTEGELDEDSDDEEMDTLDTTSVNVAQEYAGEFLFGAPAGQAKKVSSGPPPRQLGEAEAEAPQPEVDDDGFAVVSTKKGRR
jgi:pre-rRNA-processing protein TSR2